MLFSRLRTLSVAFIILIATTIAVSPAEAAKRRPGHRQYTTRSRAAWPVVYGYGFAPYIYYETYGFGGIEGAANDQPLQFGYGESTFGSSGFSFGSSTFGY